MLPHFHRSLRIWACKENLYKHFLVSQRSPNTITHEDMLGTTKINLIYHLHMNFIYCCGIKVQKKNVFLQTLFINWEWNGSERDTKNSKQLNREDRILIMWGTMLLTPLSGVFISTAWVCTSHTNKNTPKFCWEEWGHLYKGLVQKKPMYYSQLFKGYPVPRVFHQFWQQKSGSSILEDWGTPSEPQMLTLERNPLLF